MRKKIEKNVFNNDLSSSVMTLYAKTSELKLNYADLENKKLGAKLMYGTGMRKNGLLSLRILDICLD